MSPVIGLAFVARDREGSGPTNRVAGGDGGGRAAASSAGNGGSASPTDGLGPMTYRQIADGTAARAATGEYPPESRIPSYSQLSVLYRVSITTAQRAGMVLHVKGVVYGEPGKGVFVKGHTQYGGSRGADVTPISWSCYASRAVGAFSPTNQAATFGNRRRSSRARDTPSRCTICINGPSECPQAPAQPTPSQADRRGGRARSMKKPLQRSRPSGPPPQDAPRARHWL
ncbi:MULTISPECIES: winged helix-turn-helix domain-containing protein [unclassified Micromonospora]